MTVTWCRRRTWGTLLLAAALASGVHAGDPPRTTPQAVAKAFVEAWRAKDEARQKELAAVASVDPFVVADQIFQRRIEARLAEPPKESDDLDAADAYAALVAARVEGEGVPDLVKRWRAMDDGALRAERALGEVLQRVEAARREKRWADAVAAAEAAAPTIPDVAGTAGTFVLLRGAEAALSAGRVGQAETLAARARAAAVAMRWPWQQFLATRFLGEVATRSEDYARSEARHRDLVALIEHLGWRDELGRAYVSLAVALHAQGRFRESLELARIALPENDLQKDPKGRASALQILALAHEGLGESEEALRRLAEAADAYRAGGEPRGPPMMDKSRARILADAGRAAEALTVLERAARTLDDLGDRELAAETRAQIGTFLVRQGRSEDAIPRYEAALEIARAQGRPLSTAKWLERIGFAKMNMLPTDPAERTRVREEAIRALEESVAVLEKAGSLRWARQVEGKVAATYLAMGRLDAAEAHAAKMPRLDEPAFAADARWDAEQIRARLLAAQGKRAEAVERLRALVASRREAGADRSPTVHRDLARLLLEGGDPKAALEEARRALELRADPVRGFGEEEAIGLSQLTRDDADLGLRAAAAWATADAAHAADAAAAAFGLMERSRAVWLAESLARPTDRLRGLDLLEPRGKAIANVQSARRRLLAAAFGPKPDVAAAAAAREELVEAESLLRGVNARIGRAVRGLADLVEPRIVDADEVVRSLGPDAAYVAYHLAEDTAYAVVLSSQGPALVTLGSSEPIRKAADAWVRALPAPDVKDDALARRAHALLLAPLAERLGDAKRLVVSPDGALAFLPFDALLSGEGPSARRLVEERAVTCAPSATVLSLLREEGSRPAETRLLALGDPTYPGEAGGADGSRGGLASLDRLPEAGAEVRAIAALFGEGNAVTLLRDEATLGAWSAALEKQPRWRAVHLACHGFMDPEHPLSSGIVLAGGEVLGLAALFGMRVPADLAVLSACETGQGTLVRGEGVTGLVRGFFAAGTPRVVVSSWVVSDEKSRALMTAFYEAMLRQGRGPAEALRAAKLAALRAGGPAAVPRHWAAWTLWGLPD